VKLQPDRTEFQADGRDLCFITAAVMDNAGVIAPRADNRISFQIEGPGEIVATDNGDPTSLELFQSHHRKAFNGLCLVIVRGKPGEPGRISVRASGDGLKAGSISIEAKR
jgi:beta-galactosidase